MKNVKTIIIATTIAILAVATIGVALASTINNSPYYGGMMGYSSTPENEDWWNEMREHMEDHWNEIDDSDWWDEMIEHMEEHWDQVPDQVQDKEWFNDMRAYMDEHLDEVQSQDWFDEMFEFTQNQKYEYRYRYDYSPQSYGRGCWGW